jgi:hypothetical protein
MLDWSRLSFLKINSQKPNRMSLQLFFRNAAVTAQSPTFPIFVISYIILLTSRYLYKLYDIASLSDHYAFLYHFLIVCPLVVVPLALSMNERRRFQDLGYTVRWNREAVQICIGYCLLSSISLAYVWAYTSGDGASAATAKVSIGWVGLMGVNLVPLWFVARPQKS